MSNIIITAFEPFNGRETNTSLEVLKQINLKNVLKKVLPVSWDKSREEVKKFFDLGPDLVVLCGEAGGRKNIALEEKAVNLMNASIPDNDGIYRNNQKIYDSVNSYFSNIDVYDIAKKVNKDEEIVYVSSDAGTYICNTIYYHTLSIVYGNTYSTKVVFIHLPVSENEEDIKQKFPRTMELIIEEIIKKYGIKSF
ncbi:MAG: hypothetical protein IJO27_01825 [Bacilli bacterium]|nr:hypothetical protein [Bacilli bacterium]